MWKLLLFISIHQNLYYLIFSSTSETENQILSHWYTSSHGCAILFLKRFDTRNETYAHLTLLKVKDLFCTVSTKQIDRSCKTRYCEATNYFIIILCVTFLP